MLEWIKAILSLGGLIKEIIGLFKGSKSKDLKETRAAFKKMREKTKTKEERIKRANEIRKLLDF